MTLMKIAFTGGHIFTRRSFHRRGVRIGRPNFDVVIATPKTSNFDELAFARRRCRRRLRFHFNVFSLEADWLLTTVVNRNFL